MAQTTGAYINGFAVAVCLNSGILINIDRAAISGNADNIVICILAALCLLICTTVEVYCAGNVCNIDLHSRAIAIDVCSAAGNHTGTHNIGGAGTAVDEAGVGTGKVMTVQVDADCMGSVTGTDEGKLTIFCGVGYIVGQVIMLGQLICRVIQSCRTIHRCPRNFLTADRTHSFGRAFVKHQIAGIVRAAMECIIPNCNLCSRLGAVEIVQIALHTCALGGENAVCCNADGCALGKLLGVQHIVMQGDGADDRGTGEVNVIVLVNIHISVDSAVPKLCNNIIAGTIHYVGQYYVAVNGTAVQAQSAGLIFTLSDNNCCFSTIFDSSALIDIQVTACSGNTNCSSIGIGVLRHFICTAVQVHALVCNGVVNLHSSSEVCAALITGYDAITHNVGTSGAAVHHSCPGRGQVMAVQMDTQGGFFCRIEEEGIAAVFKRQILRHIVVTVQILMTFSHCQSCPGNLFLTDRAHCIGGSLVEHQIAVVDCVGGAGSLTDVCEGPVHTLILPLQVESIQLGTDNGIVASISAVNFLHHIIQAQSHAGEIGSIHSLAHVRYVCHHRAVAKVNISIGINRHPCAAVILFRVAGCLQNAKNSAGGCNASTFEGYLRNRVLVNVGTVIFEVCAGHIVQADNHTVGLHLFFQRAVTIVLRLIVDTGRRCTQRHCADFHIQPVSRCLVGIHHRNVAVAVWSHHRFREGDAAVIQNNTAGRFVIGVIGGIKCADIAGAADGQVKAGQVNHQVLAIHCPYIVAGKLDVGIFAGCPLRKHFFCILGCNQNLGSCIVSCLCAVRQHKQDRQRQHQSQNQGNAAFHHWVFLHSKHITDVPSAPVIFRFYYITVFFSPQ